MNTRIINFYSFKGGVGRSLSLVNVAYQLSKKGQKVGLIDLDIEAGGLNQILDVEASSNEDLLALLAPENRDVSNLESYVKEVRFSENDVPRVFLLPTITDSNLLDQIVWNEATQRFISQDLIPAYARQYQLDYVLIDSRSGISRFAALAIKIADLQILICRLDSQNRFGISRIVKVCDVASKPYRIVVSACPDNSRKKRYLKQFEESLGRKVDYLLPYLSDLYFREFVISKERPNHTLSKIYFNLATDLQKNLDETK
jgi:MinD-like ATPase involved in chromosome partitioning or flagellar assembly